MKEIRTVIIGFGGMGEKICKNYCRGTGAGADASGDLLSEPAWSAGDPHPLSSNGSVSGCGRYIFSSGGF